MKLVGCFFSKFAAFGVVLAISALAFSAQAQQQGQAKVQAIVGSADYSEAGGAWQKLNVGKILKAGAVIKTAAASRVDLFLKQNGPVVRVTEDTTLALDTLLFDDTGVDTVIETKLDLRNGRILGNVKPLAAASRYEVKIPNGTVGIRGTWYDISASGIVRCYKGILVVLWAVPTPTPYTVNAGYTFMPPAQPGGTPSVVPFGPNDPIFPKDLGDYVTPPGEIEIIKPIEKPISPTTGVPGR